MTQVPPQAVEGETDPEELSRRERARQEETNRALQLENLMLRNGVDPAAGLGKLFFNGYRGELTAEAVKAEIDAAGIVKPPEEPPPTPKPEDAIPESERQQTNDRGIAAAGAVPDGGTPSEDPRVLAVKNGDEVLAAGGTVESAMGAAFDTIAAAGYGSAQDGRRPDTRAQYRPGEIDSRRGVDQGW